MVDTMVSLLVFIIMAIVIGAIGIYIYKYRHVIKRYATDTRYGSEWHPSRETYLRRKIEDANAELAWLEEKDNETEAK
jgi:uncharacterized ion transporter superfamily protein YfcC